MSSEDTGRSPSALSSKRSRTVCYRCNSKKIRCDLQHASSANAGSGPGRCSACVAAGTNCEYRPSNKGRRRRPRPDSPSTVATATIPGSSTANATGNPSHYLGESPFISLFSSDDQRSQTAQDAVGFRAIDQIPVAVQQSNIETYFHHFYTWCPILDPDPNDTSTAIVPSSLIHHALALTASKIRTPLVPHATREEHYERARDLFHSCSQIDSIDGIRAAILLHWMSPKPAHVSNMSMNGKSWWHSIAIHLAQDSGLHREPRASVDRQTAGLRRRIWWTMFARERIGGICQGRPCLIDPDYCNVSLPEIDDFPPSKVREAKLFMHYVRLSVIVGDVNKSMYLQRNSGSNTLPTPAIATRLIDWVQALPLEIQLPVSTERTTKYDRDVHVLHLPYLATISLVYLNSRGSVLPEASVAAVIAASCTARLFEDLLARDSAIVLNGNTGWYATIAILALMHVRPVTSLAPYAAAQIRILRTALKHSAGVWSSARMLDEGFDRLLSADGSTLQPNATPASAFERNDVQVRSPTTMMDLCAGDGVLWPNFFPFATAQTTPLVGAILTECQRDFPELWMPMDLDSQFKEFWEEFNGESSDVMFDLST